MWEHEIWQRLRKLYERSALYSTREDLLSFRTVGWVEVLEEREYKGQLIRKYRLDKGIRPFLEYQLNLNNVLGYLRESTETKGGVLEYGG